MKDTGVTTVGVSEMNKLKVLVAKNIYLPSYARRRIRPSDFEIVRVYVQKLKNGRYRASALVRLLPSGHLTYTRNFYLNRRDVEILIATKPHLIALC